MTGPAITQGFVLAAGLGQRMRPLTDDRPKPMVEIHSRPMIAYALDQLAAHGIKRCVINTHYKAGVLHDYLARGSWPFDIVISLEPDLLDTGGGLTMGLQYLDSDNPVIVLSGDSVMVDAPQARTLDEMQTAWNAADADLLLSLQPLSSMKLTPAVGDYTIENGRPRRTPDHSGEYMWNSARILHPRLFENTSDTPFSFLDLMDRAERTGRLAAVVNRGIWHHLSTPADVANVNAGWDAA